jgi:hypothetical protein
MKERKKKKQASCSFGFTKYRAGRMYRWEPLSPTFQDKQRGWVDEQRPKCDGRTPELLQARPMSALQVVLKIPILEPKLRTVYLFP